MPPDQGRMPHASSELAERVTEVEKLTDRHELELHGDRGVYPWMVAMEGQLKWINRALWTIAVAIIGAAAAIILAGGHP